jgi:protein-tyrosine phosphatase
MTTKIVMVCLGNICRSPVAEGVMRQKIEKYKLDAVVESSGTSNFHIGAPPDSRSIFNAQKHNVDISKFKASQFSKQDLDTFDLIFVMDANNYNDVIKLASTDIQKSKISLLLNALTVNENRAVPDPYYGNANDFETVFYLIDDACEKIAMKLITQNM